MRDLGDFLIIDSIRTTEGLSVHFLEIQAFLEEYVRGKRIGLKHYVSEWTFRGAHAEILYGICNKTVYCASESIPGVPVYTWPEFQFAVNLKNILQ